MQLRKTIIILSIFLLPTVSVFAQLKVSGNIRDFKTNETIPGVSIYISDIKIGTVTDMNGNFEIPDLKQGSYLLEISYTGYQSMPIKLKLERDTTLNVSLKTSVKELDEVVITGVTRATDLKHNPVIISTIGQKEFSQNAGSTNLIDALKELPGVSQITTGPNISKPVIRGLGYNRVITLNDGIRQEGQQWGDEHGIEIDQYSVDRAEIIMGPGSLLYGSDGIAGVLNFLPPKPPLEGTIQSQITTNYQTNNNLIGYSFSNAGNKNSFQWLGRYSGKYAGNYQNKFDGKVYNSGYREYDGGLSLGLTKDWGHTFLEISSFNTKLGIIEGERDSLGRFTYQNHQGVEQSATSNDLSGYAIGVPYQLVNHTSVAVRNLFILKKGIIHADIGLQNNRRREFEEGTNPDEVGLYLSSYTLTYNLRYNFDRIKNWETSAGINGMMQNNKNEGREFLIPDYHLLDVGVFLFTQKEFKNLTLAGGIRMDNRHLNTKELYLDAEGMPVSTPDSGSELKFTPLSKNYYGLSGSIGLSYQMSHSSTLKLNLSNGFRAPDIASLSSNGKHEGTFRYEIGNSKMKPEFSHQLDVSYYFSSEHVSLQVTPFVNYISHYSHIEKMKDTNGNDIFPDPEDSVPAFTYASGYATLAGGEFYLDIHPHPLDWLHIENMFSYVSATQGNSTDSSKYLPYIPAPHYRGGLKAQFKKSNLYVKFNVDYYFAKNHIYSAYGTETPTPGYTLLSAGVGASFKVFKKKDFLNVYLSGNNLTNIAYQDHLSRLKYAGENLLTDREGVFNMGRNFSLKMIFNI
ncbi:MAG: TonB-dependent receptor [Bacteroidetes bacterium]|nr:TonB-dependent receptor [Bacteroidota bacterium]